MRLYERWALAGFALAASVSTAQTTTAPASLSVDLSRYYFKTPAEEVAGRADLNAALDQMGQFKEQVHPRLSCSQCCGSTIRFRSFSRSMKAKHLIKTSKPPRPQSLQS